MSVPDAPTITSLVAGNQTITINFTAPANDGGSAITDYKYSLNSGSYISSGTTTSPIVVTGLTNGTLYAITIVATNTNGDSAASNSLSETPYTVPSAPTITAITQTDISAASITFTLGADNGRSITDVSYSINGQPFVSSASATSPVVITGLSPGQTYGIRILSTNLAGNSAPSTTFDASMVYFFDYRSAMAIDTDGDQFLVVLRKEISGENKYFVSYDGVSWTARNYPADPFVSASPYTVRWTGNQFIMAGDFATGAGNNYLLRSTDAKAFSLLKTNLPGKVHDIEIARESAHTITFPTDTTLCLGGQSGDTYSVTYSHDGGKTWTGSIGSNSIMSSVYSATWTGKLWVAVGTGSNNTIATSTDNGVTWIGRGKYVFATNALSVASNNRVVVAVGQGTNSIAHSPDGVYWTGLGTTLMDRGTSVAYAGGVWIAVGFASDNSVVCLRSTNGTTWTPIPVPFTTTTLLKVQYNSDANTWTVYCDTAHYTSTDGVTWTTISGSVSPENMFSGTYYLSTNGTQTRYSLDNTNWSAYASISGLSVVRDFAWNHSNVGTASIQSPIIAAGEGANTLAYSPDGIHWTGLGSSMFATRANQVAWNGTLWCAVGAGNNCIAYSYDGLQWNSASVSGDIFTEAFDIAWNGTVFVAVGVNSGLPVAAASIDGITWAATSTPVPFTVAATGVVWTGQRWVIYGQGTNSAAYSADPLAQTWTPLTLPNISGTIPTRMRPLVSKNALVVSSISGDTFDLLSLTLGATDIPVGNSAIPGTAYLTGIATDGIITIVSGENGTIAYVTNSASNTSYVLTAATSSGLTHAYAVCHNGKHTVVGGTMVGGVGGIVYGSPSAGFAATNASDLMTTVWGLGTNSKYGHVVPRNTLIVNSGEKLGVVYPRNRANMDVNIGVDMIGI